MKDFTFIGMYDIKNIRKCILNNLHRFTLSNTDLNNTDNIQRRSNIHGNATHLTFFFDDNNTTPYLTINSYNSDIYKYIQEDMDNILNILKNYYDDDDMIIARCMVTCLKRNKNILPHFDFGSYILINAHRIHIPLKTNERVFFSVGETKDVYLDEGCIVEINNTDIHSVRNESDEDRYHLILDCINKNKLHII
tara:strand:+ start:436 stop:1017 length:582 start_codon:yes stop_codon:yes gene_type:complete